MCTNMGDFKIMKNISILSLVMFSALFAQVYGACSISSLENCTADINPNYGRPTLQDRILPDRIDKLKQPNSSFDNRNTQGQMHTPDNINMEPIQRENTQPYNANCQFGNCMNRTNSGANNNE